MVKRAMLEWERYTCLRFMQAKSSDQNVIVFRNNKGCYSQLGMVGGEQDRTILHELGHAIGLVHEHQLPNRDDYVEILTDNVHPDWLMEFTKYTLEAVDQMNVPYDYSSIMHFGDTTYSKDGVSKTIRVKNPEKEIIIGKVEMLSFMDVKVVNKMYKCTASCENKHKNLVECDSWAKAGDCESYPQWMIRNCQKSCGACDKPILTQAPTTTPTTDIENGIRVWMAADIALTITVIVILVAVIIAMKRRIPRNEYEVAVNRDGPYRQSHSYMDLNPTSLI
ncbi:hypothetical protein CHS0354_012952 [Potamilus streckersoni]|uniref:Metalloendopeptidase n=1 Tax=Potamilus streckersoni TaxID=2493646 RepID=A0AAE0SQ38_9BIVA|nr:hypothetical protein CHS0354_012952 [Potamilus streckersoni]